MKNPFKKKHPWFRRRGYLHFDQPVKFKSAQSLVTSPRKVSQHSFYPFLSFEIKAKKFGKDPASKKLVRKEKIRPIAYAAHLDGHIYSYYGHLLSNLYEKQIQISSIDECVLAFRKLEKSNIQFAYAAFEEIKSRASCHVICLDVKGFFDTIDHKLLKRAWQSLLGSNELPSDHYAVYKSLTKHSSVNLHAAYSVFNISVHNPKNGRTRICSGEEFRTQIRSAELIKTNTSGKGIPQGSSISALLSNIYMAPLDIEAHNFTRNIGGRYFRYCDDILAIVPQDKAAETMRMLKDEIKKLGLDLQDKKTETRDFDHVKGKLCTIKPLQYLGFLFDGERILLRSASLARYLARMKSGVRTAKKTMDKKNGLRAGRGETHRDLFKCKLNKRYSLFGRRNFLSYGYRASRLMESEAMRRQLAKMNNKFIKEMTSA